MYACVYMEEKKEEESKPGTLDAIHIIHIS